MSGLHQAVARAIAEAWGGRWDYGEPDVAAAAAVGVCLAEAQRAVEAPAVLEAACIAFVGEPWRNWSDGQRAACRERMGYALDDVLAVLAALAEEQA